MVSRRDAKDWAREKMVGIWTSPMFPFTADFALDEAGIRKNVERMLQVKSGGLGFGFSEPWVCTIAERKRAMEVAVDAVRGRVPAYLHSTDHSVAETIALTKHAQAAGADAVMIWPPYEWAKSQEMICEYYEYVAAQVDIAIFAYNTYHSGVAMSLETIERIARIPNVCALKNAINDMSHSIQAMERVGKQIVVSEPVEANLLPMALHFGQQVMLGTTSVFLMQSPACQPIYDYFQLARAGKAAEASKAFYDLQPLRDVWNGIYQVLWDKKGATHPLPYLKYWMELVGMAAGPVRPPMHGLTEDDKAQFRARLYASGWMQRLFPETGARGKVASVA